MLQSLLKDKWTTVQKYYYLIFTQDSLDRSIRLSDLYPGQLHKQLPPFENFLKHVCNCNGVEPIKAVCQFSGSVKCCIVEPCKQLQLQVTVNFVKALLEFKMSGGNAYCMVLNANTQEEAS